MSRERLGNVLSKEVEWHQCDGRSITKQGVKKLTDQDSGAPPDPDAEAEAFVRFCYRRRAVAWPELYDEMCAVAARGEYRGMDYEELARLGIGFGLPSLPRLSELAARVIAQERTRRPIAAVA